MSLPEDATDAAAAPAPAAGAPAAGAPAAAPPHQINIAHEDHDHDPSNPHFFRLPLGVILAGIVAVISVGITAIKFIHPFQALGLHH